MNIAYLDPLSRAWNRMTTALFRPFDIGKWFVVGFTAFLANLFDSYTGGGSHFRDRNVNYDNIFEFPQTAWDWLLEHSFIFSLIVFGLIVLVAVLILLVWLSSRGKFMFLDNVVHDRAQITQPWYNFKTAGNSLFAWRICFFSICLLIVIAFIVAMFSMAQNIYKDSGYFQNSLLEIFGMGFLATLLVIMIAYVSLFLNNFIVPIMYKHNISATEAWDRFLTVFGHHWPYFIVFGLFTLALRILVTIIIVIIGVATCCLGLLLLAIPYLGSVITLPISYTFRSLGPEFLGQFGDEFAVFSLSEETSVDE